MSVNRKKSNSETGNAKLQKGRAGRGRKEVRVNPRLVGKVVVHHDVSAVAARLGISERQVRRLVADGDMKSHLFRNSRRVSDDNLLDYVTRSQAVSSCPDPSDESND